MSTPAAVANRLGQLSARLATARQSDLHRYGRFFAALGARVEGARAVARELDRLLARRFNALDYLRADEHGLSRIVADLLDPRGAHGQGTGFLSELLGLGGVKSVLSWPVLDRCRITTITEREIVDARRIDISVEIIDANGDAYCLAIENKPFADDQQNQVVDYLKFLESQYADRFLLVYLSPNGEGPSDRSIDRGALQGWKKRFAIMAYSAGPAERTDEFEGMRIPFDLADWLRECRKTCDVDRLRWFLREVETFCHKTFGGPVTTTSERKEVRDFILASDDNVRTAIAVAEAWPETRDEVVRRFLKALRDRLADDLREFEDLLVESGFGHRGERGGVRVFRTTWSTDGGARSLIWLSPEWGVNDWFVGVEFDHGDGDGDADAKDLLRELLRRAMQGGAHNSLWPWYRYLEEHKDWGPLVARLHEESGNAGEFVDYFSRRVVELARAAVPIVDEVLASR